MEPCTFTEKTAGLHCKGQQINAVSVIKLLELTWYTRIHRVNKMLSSFAFQQVVRTATTCYYKRLIRHCLINVKNNRLAYRSYTAGCTITYSSKLYLYVLLNVHFQLYSYNESIRCTVLYFISFPRLYIFRAIFSPSSGGQVYNVVMGPQTVAF
jgi:hypothetical protein